MTYYTTRDEPNLSKKSKADALSKPKDNKAIIKEGLEIGTPSRQPIKAKRR